MFSHPALIFALVGSNSERKAFFAQQNVSAVTGVNGTNHILFGEMNDITFFGIDISLCMQAAYKVVGSIAQLDKSLFAHTGHNIHI